MPEYGYRLIAMKLPQLKSLLRAHPAAHPRFLLPGGGQIPAHFHLVEAGRFADILDLGKPILPSDDLDVEVEWDCCVISQYPIKSTRAFGDQIEFQLAANHTDCLAKEKCGCESEAETSAAAGCCG